MSSAVPITPAPGDAAEVPAPGDWLAKMQAESGDEAEVTALGPRHWAVYLDGGPRLLVTFDTIGSARARKTALPLLQDFASVMGWSYLCILSDGATWYRDPAVYGDFDARVLEGFFDDFDRVLFYGAGMAGHAALAFSASAPGAEVLAIAPRASMSPAAVPFETRDRAARRFDFTSRFGFAPAMVRGAGAVWILRDPKAASDAAHAAMFHGAHVKVLNLALMSDRIETALLQADILPKLLDAAMRGEMSAHLLARLWRVRRQFAPYLAALMARCEATGHRARARVVCANVARRTRAPAFLRRLEEMDAGNPAKG